MTRLTRRRFLTLSAAFACAPRLAEAGTWQGRALGAEVSVTLHGPRETVNKALAALPARLEEIENLFSLYRPNSMLNRLNKTGHHAGNALFHAQMDVVDQAYSLTDGLFDPTVQPLWHALAMGEDTTEARALIGWDRIARTNGKISLAPGQKLTLNGIAQGFATDLIRSDLRDQGFTNALIDIGEFAALGGPFQLGLEDPEHGALGQVTLTDTARATSSPGALILGSEPHILGPRNEPSLWSTLSIEAPSAALADALSTAAVFMDRKRLARLKSDANLSRITAVDPDGDLLTI
jgi:thiamine biosynthesis lipoprotein